MKEITKALLKAQQNATTLAKDGENKFGKFSYTSIEEVVQTARGLLHSQSLVFFPVTETQDNFILTVQYRLLHVESGEHLDIYRTMIIPEANGMSPCQAQGSAESYMLKNVLRELLLIPRFDKKEDLDSQDNTGYKPRVMRTPGNPARAGL